MKYQIKIEDRVFEVEITDLDVRPIIAVVDGEPVEVWPQDDTPPTPSPGRTSAAAARATYQHSAAQTAAAAGDASAAKVYAPMPGVIISIRVQPGDAVTYGQELCVLEAMKMKNTIRASRNGEIGTVHTSVGQQVNHHDLLMEYVE